jgi:hypothetical protein
MIRKIEEKAEHKDERRAIGILLGNPSCKFVKENILHKMGYYNERSHNNIDFYFPGYGAYWPLNGYPDAIEICMEGFTKWLFSNKEYSNFIKELESKSKWKYTGEAEVLIIDYKDGELDFSQVLVFWLDKMVQDNIIYSPSNFFEKIFEIFEENKKNKSTMEFSKSLKLNNNKETFLEFITQSISQHVQSIINKRKYYCIKDFRKNKRNT